MSEPRVGTSGWQPEKKTFEKLRWSVPDDFVYAVEVKQLLIGTTQMIDCGWTAR